MKVIFAGGRDVPDEKAKHLVVDAYFDSPFRRKLTEVVEGGASGIDAMARRIATNTTIKVKTFHADWKTHGKAAGPIRDKQMAEYADALIAIWDGQSRGTKNMIETMQKLGKPVYVHRYNPAAD